MDLIDRLSDLAARIKRQRDHVRTEEAVKTSFVLPFIQALGYDVFNPQEIIPELTADHGVKKGEKVDYAIQLDGKVQVLIECKQLDAPLESKHAGQLFRYFTVTEAKFGVLTDGVRYLFYTDLDAPNKMDEKPFFEFIEAATFNQNASPTPMDKIDARKLSRDALKALRGQAMRMRQTLGLPWREIARVMGLNTTTVFGWAQRYAAEGEAGLVSRKPGRTYLSGRTLTLPQEWVLRTILTSQAPSTRGLPFALWNRRAVRDLIKVEFGIDMPIRTVGEYLKRWGYTLQRPTRQALEQKPWDVQRWMQEVYPLIAQKAKQEDGVIYWADETAVAQDGHWVRGYAPAGHAPVLQATSQRFGLTMVSAISSKGLVRFEFLEGAANTETTLGFMQRLVQDNEGHKVFLVLDNLRAHHAKDVTAWVQAHEQEIEVFYLPPYAPQSNPDEYLNRDFKTQLRSADRCKTPNGLLDKAAAFMQFLVSSPERVKSYFQHDSVAYAA